MGGGGSVQFNQSHYKSNYFLTPSKGHTWLRSQYWDITRGADNEYKVNFKMRVERLLSAGTRDSESWDERLRELRHAIIEAHKEKANSQLVQANNKKIRSFFTKIYYCGFYFLDAGGKNKPVEM